MTNHLLEVMTYLHFQFIKSSCAIVSAKSQYFYFVLLQDERRYVRVLWNKEPLNVNPNNEGNEYISLEK